MGKITTHVLDTSHGVPGRGIAVALYRLDKAGARQEITHTHTNHDGRCDAPLCEGSALVAGIYELDFAVGEYYDKFAGQNDGGTQKPDAAKIPFLDRVTLRFGVGDAAAHYHVPLLVTPWSYSTYRGS
ncbi:MAG: hydroxyisourate hydrolase [Alphaproteobacteria bacterium]|nr:hydroxyisourate hydrolase [Alphaproteobacteria bacterium]